MSVKLWIFSYALQFKYSCSCFIEIIKQNEECMRLCFEKKVMHYHVPAIWFIFLWFWETVTHRFTGLDKQFFQTKIVSIFLPISLIICFGCSKEPLHQDVSNQYLQHMFWLWNKKFFFLIHTLNQYKPTKLPFCGTAANSAKPDQTPDQVLHCLLKKLNKNEKYHPTTL